MNRVPRLIPFLGGVLLLGLMMYLGGGTPAEAAKLERQDVTITGRLQALAGLNVGLTSTSCGGTDAGGGTYACTLGPPYPSYTRLTCLDSFGCVMTMAETAAVAGDVMVIENAGTPPITFSDTSGVSELEGTFVMRNQDELVLIYGGSAWFEVSRKINASTNTAACPNMPDAGVSVLTLGPPYPETVLLTVNDTHGCNVTLAETNAKSGDKMRIVNVSSNAANFADTSGVSETAGTFAAGAWDSITYVYAVDRWVELGRSNN